MDLLSVSQTSPAEAKIALFRSLSPLAHMIGSGTARSAPDDGLAG